MTVEILGKTYAITSLDSIDVVIRRYAIQTAMAEAASRGDLAAEVMILFWAASVGVACPTLSSAHWKGHVRGYGDAVIRDVVGRAPPAERDRAMLDLTRAGQAVWTEMFRQILPTEEGVATTAGFSSPEAGGSS
jgi:hypothetical protein